MSLVVWKQRSTELGDFQFNGLLRSFVVEADKMMVDLELRSKWRSLPGENSVNYAL